MENSSSNATIESTTQNESESAGCGCSNITISVNPTTGGQFDLAVTKNDTIENLKKLISKKLKVPKERICLLYRERQLRDGTIQENHLVNGSRLTLLPSVETGLLAQRPEQSVMQALENLNDCQVNDFLSGKAPLNLTMRLGDHMMLIQLQLSTVTPNSSSGQSSSASTSSTSSSYASKRVLVTSPNKPASASSSSSSINKATMYPPHPMNSANQMKDPLASLSSIVESTTPSSIPSAVSSLNSCAPAAPVSATPSNVRNNVEPVTPASSSSSVSPPHTTATSAPSIPPAATATSPSISSTLTSPSSFSSPTSSTSLLEGCKCDSTTTASSRPTLDTRALAEASRNLTQTLKQLSSEVLTSKSDPIEDVSTNIKRRQGAIIESMHHHGKGVYSGTFSGTLNPALQDRFGRPKRDISTIIHILNDLLCATPQYRNCRGTSSTSASNSNISSNNINSNTSNINTNTSNSEKPATIPQSAPVSATSDAEASSSGYTSTTESLENQATRGKMERLRLIMEERREKRRAARSSPYARNTSGSGQTNNSGQQQQHLNSAANSSAVVNQAQQQLQQTQQQQQQQWSAKSETQRTTPQATANATTSAAATTDQPNLPMDTDLCSQPDVSPEPVVA